MKLNRIWIVLGIVLIFGFWIAASIVGNYNKLVTLEERVNAQYAQVDSALQRRYDLIPNLVKVVQAYAKHEKEIFVQIADARAKLAGSTNTNEKVKAYNQLESALSRLLVIVENYPILKADSSFLKLQDQLEGTENRINVERNRYNVTVQNYNQIRRSFPTVVWGKFLGFELSKEFFKASDIAKNAPQVQFE